MIGCGQLANYKDLCGKRLTSEETDVLKKIFKNLCQRGKDNLRIDKNTFLQFFEYPGLWGERIFKKFAFKGSEFIDFEEFVCGVAICCRGTEKEKIDVLFEILDLDNDGFLNRTELITMLSSVPNLEQYLVPIDDLSCADADEQFEAANDNVTLTKQVSLMNSRNTKIFKTQTAERYAENMLEHCGAHASGLLKPLEFRTWVKCHGELLHIFSYHFHEEYWSVNSKCLFRQSEDSWNSYLLPSCPDSQYSCFKCFQSLLICPTCNATLKFVNQSESSLICVQCHNCYKECWQCKSRLMEFNINLDNFSESSMEGYLYKIGKHFNNWKRRYYMLINNSLYYYKKKDDSKPKGFIFIESCCIDKLPYESKSMKYPIKMSLEEPDAEFKGKVFYADSMEDQEKWLCALKVAAKQHLITEKYEFIDFIGAGRFSEVYKSRCIEDSSIVAVKCINKHKLNANEKRLLKSEVQILKVLRHPNLISLQGCYDCFNYLYLVTEIVEGGNLFDIVLKKRYLPESAANKIIKQVILGIDYLHSHGIIHRDLKPENILISDGGLVKIADFGLSCICAPKSTVKQACGTLAYAAPEVLSHKGYCHKADIWSVGVTLYLLLSGKIPFPPPFKKSSSQASNDTYILKFDECTWSNVSPSGKEFISLLLQPDISKRLSSAEALQHIWLKNPSAVIRGYSKKAD